jgi:hypothetical protein
MSALAPSRRSGICFVQVEEDGIVGARLAAELRDELLALRRERLLQLAARFVVRRNRAEDLAGLFVLVVEALREVAALVFHRSRRGFRPISRRFRKGISSQRSAALRGLDDAVRCSAEQVSGVKWVRFDGDIAWLSVVQMAELFQRDRSVILRHIANVFEEGELDAEQLMQIAQVQREGDREVNREIEFLQPRRLSREIASGHAVPDLGDAAAARAPDQRVCAGR